MSGQAGTISRSNGCSGYVRGLWPGPSHPATIHELNRPVGLDIEWDQNRITWFAAADRNRLVAMPYEPWMREWALGQPVLVGHNIIAADAVRLGLPRDPDRYEDTIVAQWLLHAHLCKAAAGSDEDEGAHRYMGLWTAASIYTDLPNWKACAGRWCEGRPCPTHDIRWYNAVDAWAPLLVWERQQRELYWARLEELYRLHKRLMFVLAALGERGVPVDRAYVESVESRMQAARRELESRLGFNPRSPRQVQAALASAGYRVKATDEQTLGELYGRHPDDQLLGTLVSYKQLGAGLSRWFGPEYLGPDDRVHPMLGIFTSTGRLQCARPNMQNVAKRRGSSFEGEPIGRVVRRAVRAPEGWTLVSADYSNAENRAVLWQAGAEMPDRSVDMHRWMADSIGLTDSHPVSVLLGGAREAAKSIVHAANYAEGLSLVHPDELASPRLRSEIAAGIREVHPDWTFCGMIVTFTGINLARRVFGNAGVAARRRALEISRRYFQRFPAVRELQRRVLAEAESGEVRSPDGYRLRLFGSPADMAKTALAFIGSNPVAHATKLALIAAEQAGAPVRPILQVHDELLFEAPADMPDSEIVDMVRSWMEQPVAGGLVLPTKIKRGPTWADMEPVG